MPDRGAECVSDAWEALLRRAGASWVERRAAYVADAESCNEVALRMRPVPAGMLCEVFVVRSDGTELAPFDSCVLPTPAPGGRGLGG